MKAVVSTTADESPRLAIDESVLVHLPATHFIVKVQSLNGSCLNACT